MRSQKGQAFILIVVVLLVMVVLLVLVPMREARVKSTPFVQQVFFQMSGQNVTTSYVDEDVEVHVVIKATEQYSGSIVVKVRKDVSLWFDSDYTVKTFPVDLAGDQVSELELAFVPDRASGSTLRGYFVEIDFTATHTDWVMENLYPPRFRVLQNPQGENVLA